MEFNADAISGRLTRKNKKELDSSKKKFNSPISHKKVAIEITESTLRGIVISSKLGQLDIHETFTLDKEDIIGPNKSFLSDEALSLIMEKLIIHKVAKKKASFIFSTLGADDKVLKYPPLDKKTLESLITESYTKFFTDKSPDNIKGTELLGDMGIPKGEVYYLISKVPKTSILDISMQVERKKIRIDTIYNETLALKNVMNLVNRATATICMLYTKGEKAYVLLTRNNTLIFHKIIEGGKVTASPTIIDLIPANSKDGYWGSMVDTTAPPEATEDSVKLNLLLANVIPDVQGTIDFIRIKENYIFDELLISGDVAKLPDIEELLTEELGIPVKKLDIANTEKTQLDIANWTYDDITADFIVPLGLALKGVVR
jgi:hypothetical protein